MEGKGSSLDGALWRRIEAVRFDDPAATLPFTARLARDNGWTARTAGRALAEYRRFAYLAVTADRPVTPSDAVDQVWHLHLAYSRHYWGPWTEALGRPLHHGPTAGSADATRRYAEAYARTFEAYFQAFGEEPPEDLWPDPVERFAVARRMRRIDGARHLVVPTWPLRQGAQIGLVGFAGLLVLGPLAGAPGLWVRESGLGRALLSEPGLANAVCFLVLAVAGGVLVVRVAAWVRRRLLGGRRRRRTDGSWRFSLAFADGDGDGCSGCGD